MAGEFWQTGSMLALKTLGLYLAFCVCQVFFLRGRLFKALAIWLNLAFLTFSVLLFLGARLEAWQPNILYAVGAAFIFFCLTVLLRVADALVFDHVLLWHGRRPVPVVLRDIGRWILTATAFFLIIRIMFPAADLNVIALSSIVVGYIVGNATQETLGNLISGLALNTERPFQIGDWVMVNGHIGRVVDMTWRATRLQTKTEDYVIIPNGAISRDPIINYSRPTTTHGRIVQVGVSYDAPPKRVREIILQAVRATPGILADPPPRVYLSGYGDFSVNYNVKFFVNDFQQTEIIDSNLLDLFWYYFKRANISIPFPIRDVRVTNVSPAEHEARAAAQNRTLAETLRRVDLFAGLDDATLEFIVPKLKEQIYAADEKLVRQGDEGDSFYLIWRGSVAVIVRGEEGRETEVARLGEGAFFGEMSLLTGERRSATIQAVVDTTVLRLEKATLAEVIQRNSQVADQLARVLAHRTSDRQAKLDAARDADAANQTAVQVDLLKRIRAFFGLKKA